MSSSDDYGKRHAPTFTTMPDGKPGRFVGLREPDEPPPPDPLVKQRAISGVVGPTWLEEIAGLLVQLPYGDMIEYAEGTAGDPAKIFAWAQAKVREGGDAV